MPVKRDDPARGEAAVGAVLAALDAGQPPPPGELRPAVRHLLDLLAERAPGRAVEVRVPPYAAVQCIEGPRHTRGTPPNVVETDPDTWIGLATGRLAWTAASAAGRIAASGPRADLSGYLPVWPGSPAG
jgi:Bacterial SCP ortholog